jgi:hypothetical protein
VSIIAISLSLSSMLKMHSSPATAIANRS